MVFASTITRSVRPLHNGTEMLLGGGDNGEFDSMDCELAIDTLLPERSFSIGAYKKYNILLTHKYLYVPKRMQFLNHF